MKLPAKIMTTMLLFPMLFCLRGTDTGTISQFHGLWERIDSLSGRVCRLELDTPNIIGILKWQTPDCSVCASMSYEIDGIWYNDEHFFYYLTGDSDTVVMEYRFDDNGKYLYLNGVGSGLTRTYLMFDSLYLKKTG